MIARKPKPGKETKAADQFIRAGAGRPVGRRQLKPVMINFDTDLLERIDRHAKGMGLSRSSFVVFAAAEKLRAMGS